MYRSQRSQRCKCRADNDIGEEPNVEDGFYEDVLAVSPLLRWNDLFVYSLRATTRRLDIIARGGRRRVDANGLLEPREERVVGGWRVAAWAGDQWCSLIVVIHRGQAILWNRV